MNFKLIGFLFAVTLIFSCKDFNNKPNEKKGWRIISLSKQLTEIIFAVGGDTALVGTDLSSNYPEGATHITKVGYHRALNAEGIISLRPTEVWHDGNIAPEHVITQLKQVGIPLRQWDGGNTIDSVKLLIQQLGITFHNKVKADDLCNQLDSDMAIVQQERKKYQDMPKVMIIHFGQAANKYFVLNRQGVPNKMIEWAGGENAADTAQKWKDLSAEIIAQAQPDVILATDYGYDLQGSLEKFRQLPGISLSPAAKNNRIYRIEEHDLVYLGPRTGKKCFENNATDS